jgi:hypothetical protein
MGLSTGGSWLKTGLGKVRSSNKFQRRMGRYLVDASVEVAKAIERRDGSQGPASEVRKVEVTPELKARYGAK